MSEQTKSGQIVKNASSAYNYKYSSLADLHKAGIFSDDDFEIATNALRKVKPKEEIAEKEQKKEKSDKWTIKK